MVLTPRELRVRYRQSLLDAAWALVSPVVILIVYGIVLTQAFDVGGGCAPYLSSAWTGLVLWTFFATTVGTAVHSLITSANLITKVYFPRESLPLSMAGASMVDLGIGLATLAVLLPVQGVRPGWPAVASVLPILVVVVWAAAIGVLVAVVAAFVRDVPHAVQLGLRVGFFATPVMYEASVLPAGLAWAAEVNPVAVAITELRASLLCGQWPDYGLLGAHLAAGLALLGLAVAYTARVERRITDVV